MTIKASVLVILGLEAASAHAQEMRIVSAPEIGVENTVPAGSEVYSFSKLYTIQGGKLDAEAKAGHWLLEDKWPAGTELVPVPTTKAFKACVPAMGTFSAVGPCFIDDDGDGNFDRQSADEVTMFRKLKPRVPYSRTQISVTKADSFKTVILYQGANADSIRFSYREFNDNLARPAFTEELTIPREKLPSTIRVKGLQMEVLGVTGIGLRYRIVKVM